MLCGRPHEVKSRASTGAGLNPSALATVIPAAIVYPVIYIRVIYRYYPALHVKVEGGVEVGAVALVTGAAPLGQGECYSSGSREI